MYDVWYYWGCQPHELLWVGGAYASDPRCFPACQQETAWIYANLRPLHIQPPIDLMRIHFARPWMHGADWPARLTRTHELSVEACGVQLHRYMKLHGMLNDATSHGLWYGCDLPDTWFRRSHSQPSWRSRSKEDQKWGAYEQAAVEALDHPMIPSLSYNSRSLYPFHLPSAPRLEQMHHADGTATAHTFVSKYRDEEDAMSQGSVDNEDYYGTLA